MKLPGSSRIWLFLKNLNGISCWLNSCGKDETLQRWAVIEEREKEEAAPWDYLPPVSSHLSGRRERKLKRSSKKGSFFSFPVKIEQCSHAKGKRKKENDQAAAWLTSLSYEGGR